MAQATERVPARAGINLWERAGAFVALTKPRIIELLLITTLPSMFLASEGWPDLWLVVATLIGGALTAGASNAFNMVLDRDIDAVMARTKGRPLPAGRLDTGTAVTFGAVLAISGPMWLWTMVNLQAATIAAAGMVFYVYVYTAFLKRRTAQNIVIGGAAGAVPALVGWVAVTGELHPAAWVLFALVFLWTPPHFWALAVMKADEYADARVPMLPVVKGAAAAARSSLRYAVATVAVSLALPLVYSRVGWLYLAAASCLGSLFIGRTAMFRKNPSESSASQLFGYSIVYLAGVSLAVVLDQITPPSGL